MARIRTIKPEFWTDSTIVSLPFEARLLFIGLWNFCDDEGFVRHDPYQLKLQILPSDDVDCGILIDALVCSGLLEVCVTADGTEVLRVVHFCEHQKISHASQSLIAPEVSGKKQTIPAHARRLLAEKYGCKPGEHTECSCYYCGEPGVIHWPMTSRGTPGGWVWFSLSIDHFTAEANGGATEAQNLVLSCIKCNKSKGVAEPLAFSIRNIPEDSGVLQRAQERSSLNGKEWKGKEPSPPPTPSESIGGDGDDGDGDGGISWDEVRKKLAATGVAGVAQALRSAREHGLTPRDVLELIEHYQAAGDAWKPGALQWRISNGVPDQATDQGWPPKQEPVNHRPREPAVKPEQSMAVKIIRNGRRAQKTDDEIGKELQAAGLTWPG